MTIPLSVDLFSLKVQTLDLWLLVAYAVPAILYWFEAKTDGFDEERVLDMYFLLSALSVVLVGVLNLVFGHSLGQRTLENFLSWVIFLILISILSAKRLNWSVYRVLDITSLAVLLGTFVYTLGLAFVFKSTQYLLICFLLVVTFQVTYSLRSRVASGGLFSILTVLLVLFSFTFFRTVTHLPFYVMFIIIGIVTTYFRHREHIMTKYLSPELITKLKAILLSKEKRLTTEEQELKTQDPYLQAGHETVEEYLDDAGDDILKEEYDHRIKLVRSLKVKVKKALAKINIGSYGICEVCKEPISQERLLAYPEATTCVKHAV